MTDLLLSNPIINAYRESDLLGKGIFLSLILLSVITWVLFFQKFLLYRETRCKGKQLFDYFHSNQINPLSIEIGQVSHPYHNLYQTLRSNTLDLLKKNQLALAEARPVYLSHSDLELLENHLYNRVAIESKKMSKNLFLLMTISRLAPFLGLLGTVWGILLTLDGLQVGGVANSAIMGELSMALGTTVLGLIVAIPALIFYNFLKASTANLASEMDALSHTMLATIDLHYREIEIAR